MCTQCLCLEINFSCHFGVWYRPDTNKANLRYSIAATGLVISNLIQIVDFSARIALKFDGWPRKSIEYFLYITLSFVQHFKYISEFKLGLQSGNAQIGSNMAIICPVWTWNFMDDLGYKLMFHALIFHRNPFQITNAKLGISKFVSISWSTMP